MASGRPGRYWGFWTRGKLDLLRRYLNAFTTASKSVTERTYLDLFGGQPTNRERVTEADLDGSARIALSIDNPPFTRLRFFELEPYATRLRSSLKRDFPSSDFEVVPGDCNQTITSALTALNRFRWAPTFAFIDPNGPDISWSTLETLSCFKRRAKTKTEIWMLLAAGMFTRNLRVDGKVRPEAANELTTMYGTDHWQAIYTARVSGTLTPAEAREEYVNLMRWRLEKTLGYGWTHPLEIFNEQGTSIYHMIFATDSDAGNQIMTHLYNRAANEFPAMRRTARRHRELLDEQTSGIQRLFGPEDESESDPVAPNERLYRHTPPWVPYGSVTS